MADDSKTLTVVMQDPWSREVLIKSSSIEFFSNDLRRKSTFDNFLKLYILVYTSSHVRHKA